jgi:predicted ThiF/HesA family dinucleotide-utilizing enzyme
MVSKTLYFGEKQVEFLKEINDLTFSEHVRIAVNEYIDRKKLSTSSGSRSKKVGGSNG